MSELSETGGPFLLYTGGKEVKAMKYFKIYTDFLEVTAELGDGAMGRLFRAMLLYAQNGTAPELRGKEAVAWAVARQQIDREAAAYEGKVSSMERARSCRNKQKTAQHKLISREDNDKDKYKYKNKDNDSLSAGGAGAPEEREKRPTLEEVLRFSQEEGLATDADYFYNYYEANGWRIGKYPIRDWRAALRAWSRKAPSAGPARATGYADEYKAAMEMIRAEEAKQI